METKKKLRKDLTALEKVVSKMSTDLNEFIRKVNALTEELKALEEEADTITGKEAARMLGWNYEYVSSSYLSKIGVKHYKDANGNLKISRKSLEDYLYSKGNEPGEDKQIMEEV